MNITVIIINAVAIICLLVSFIRDRGKTWRSLKVAGKMFIKMLPTVLTIIVVIGLINGFVGPEQISMLIGSQSGIMGIIIIGLVGAVMHIPSIISFPLAASLLEKGASISAVAAFITTLTMIGTITLPLEIKLLGKKMALLRNGMSFIIAIIIALIMGAIL